MNVTDNKTKKIIFLPSLILLFELIIMITFLLMISQTTNKLALWVIQITIFIIMMYRTITNEVYK